MSRLQTSFVLGYHGCDAEVGERLLAGAPMGVSGEKFDWLGRGAYFWEADPLRAREWADWKVGRGEYQRACVVGAVIDLGNCLDATTRDGAEAIRLAHDSLTGILATAGAPVPRNVRARRYLDCAVINHLHDLAGRRGIAFDTVRGLFPQGERVYPGAGFWKQTHIQIAVVNPDNIKGVFRV